MTSISDPAAIIAALHSQIFDPDRLPVAVAALIVVSVFGVFLGPLKGNANPLFWIVLNAVTGGVGQKLDRPERSPRDLISRGMFFTLLLLSLSFLAGTGMQMLEQYFPNFLISDLVALSILLSSGAGWKAILRLYKAMIETKTVPGAFYALAVTSRVNLAVADEYTITRTGISMGARLFDKAMVAPILWYLIAGLPAAYFYAGLTVAAWRYGRDGQTKGFGATALAMEKLMGFVPNMFAGVLIACAGLLTPTAGMIRSLGGLIHVGKSLRAGYYEGGAVITAMAFSLKVSLGGPVQDLDGVALKRGWAGPEGASARLEASHLRRALYILVMAHLLFLAAMLVAMVLAGGGFSYILPQRP